MKYLTQPRFRRVGYALIALLLAVSCTGSMTAYALISSVTAWGTTGSGNGQLDLPTGIAVASNGNVYVGENNNHRIQVFDPDGNFLSIFNDTDVSQPQGMAFDSTGNLWVLDSQEDTFKKFDSTGTLLATYGSTGTGNGQFDTPSDLAVDSDGYIYVADYTNARIQKFDSSGNYVSQWGSAGSGNGQFTNPIGIAVDSDNNVYVSEDANCRVQKFTSDGTFVTKWGSMGSGDGQLFIPQKLAVDSSGNVYVTDSFNGRLEKFSSTGAYLDKYTGPFNSIYNVAVDNAGAVYTVEYGGNQVQKLLDSDVSPPNTAPNAPSALGPANVIDSSIITTNQPTLNFTLSDPNGSDTVKYNLQIDNTLNFSSPLVDYTSALGSQGAKSFTVGQAAGAGAYAVGAAGQALPDGWYYWRIKAVDNSDASSSYVMAHGNAIAFTVDTSAPTVPGTPMLATSTTNLKPTWQWAESADAGSGLAPTPYSVQLARDASFTTSVSSDTTPTNSYTAASTLSPGKWYFRVKAQDAIGQLSAYSAPVSVSLVQPLAPSENQSGGNPSSSPSDTVSDTSTPSDTTSTSEPSGDETAGEQPTKTEKQPIVLNDYGEFTSGDGKQLQMSKGDVATFTADGEEHSVTVKQVGGDFAVLTLASTPRDVRLETGQTKSYDVTDDDKDDITVTLASTHGGVATLGFAVPSTPQDEGTAAHTSEKSDSQKAVGNSWLLYAGIGAVLLAIIVTVILRRRA
ncbi:MAG TPA: 6-bladed beta-propeller, partial [Candidatus Saccharimonadales bacterium]|nr:6-bladed beta-propeller [Candidatus Saccharimonadales bacterium]